MATVAAVAFAGPALTRGPAAHSLSAAAATRAAMTSSSIAVPGMQIHVVNLHQQFARSLAAKSVVTAPEAGIVPMRTGHGTAAPAAATAGTATAAAAASCKEPDCNMSRHGGAGRAGCGHSRDRDRRGRGLLQGTRLQYVQARRCGPARAARLPAALGT
jgi:hypothetical protein